MKNEEAIYILLEIYDLTYLKDSVAVRALPIWMMDTLKRSREHPAESFTEVSGRFTQNLPHLKFLKLSRLLHKQGKG